jgi:hypothetical protein
MKILGDLRVPLLGWATATALPAEAQDALNVWLNRFMKAIFP